MELLYLIHNALGCLKVTIGHHCLSTMLCDSKTKSLAD
jgi:hypothetical protein